MQIVGVRYEHNRFCGCCSTYVKRGSEKTNRRGSPLCPSCGKMLRNGPKGNISRKRLKTLAEALYPKEMGL